MRKKPQNIHRYVQDPQNKPKKDWFGLQILGWILLSSLFLGNLIAFGVGATEYNMFKRQASQYTQQERIVEHCRGDFTRIEIVVPGFYLGCTAGPLFDWLGDSLSKKL